MSKVKDRSLFWSIRRTMNKLKEESTEKQGTQEQTHMDVSVDHYSEEL